MSLGGRVHYLRHNAASNAITDTSAAAGRVITRDPYHHCIACGALIHNLPIEKGLPKLTAEGPVYGHITCKCVIRDREQRLQRNRETRSLL